MRRGLRAVGDTGLFYDLLVGPAQLRPRCGWRATSARCPSSWIGSDWPACTLAASYDEVLALAREALGTQLTPAELDAIFASNALTTYGPALR